MHPLSLRHKINKFLLIVIILLYYICFYDIESFFEFLVSVINQYHINWLHLFWDSFEWFCLQIRSDIKYPPPCPRHCDQELIVVIVYCFQIRNKKEHSIIIYRVISSYTGLIYIDIFDNFGYSFIIQSVIIKKKLPFWWWWLLISDIFLFEIKQCFIKKSSLGLLIFLKDRLSWRNDWDNKKLIHTTEHEELYCLIMWEGVDFAVHMSMEVVLKMTNKEIKIS